MEDGLYHLLDGDAVHAAEVDGALSAKAGRAWDIRLEQVVSLLAGQAGSGEVCGGAAKNGYYRYAYCRGQMHRAGVVGEEEITRL